MKLIEGQSRVDFNILVQFMPFFPIMMFIFLSWFLLGVFDKPVYWYVIFIIIYIFLSIGAWKLGHREVEENLDRAYLKESGEKVKGNIIGTGKWNVWYKIYMQNKEYFYIDVEYNDKIIQINNIVNNTAFRILEELIIDNSDKKDLKIPVDIYTKDNKYYVDLNSVDLTKIEGYKSVKNIIEHFG